MKKIDIEIGGWREKNHDRNLYCDFSTGQAFEKKNDAFFPITAKQCFFKFPSGSRMEIDKKLLGVFEFPVFIELKFDKFSFKQWGYISEKTNQFEKITGEFTDLDTFRSGFKQLENTSEHDVTIEYCPTHQPSDRYGCPASTNQYRVLYTDGDDSLYNCFVATYEEALSIYNAILSSKDYPELYFTLEYYELTTW